MKKFNTVLKWIAVACSITFVVGFTLSIVSLKKYNGNFSDFVQNNSDVIGSHFSNGINTLIENGIDNIDKVITIKSSNSSELNNYKNLNKEIDLESIKNLDIKCDISKIEIIESNNNQKAKLTCKYLKDCDIKSNGDKTNIIINNGGASKNIKNTSYNLKIELPKDFCFDNLDISTDLGNIKLNNIKFKSSNIDSRLGNVDIDNDEYTIAENMDINLSLGKLEIKNMDAINSKLYNNMGNVIFKVNNKGNEKYNELIVSCDCGKIETSFNYLNRNISFENDLGETDIIVKNTAKNLDFDILSDVGKVTNNLKVEEDSNLSNRYKIKIRNDMGNIKLEH